MGCIFSDDFSHVLDIDRCFKSFNKSAGFLLRNFFYASSEVKYSLFNSFCSSMYGCELNGLVGKSVAYLLKNLVCHITRH